MRGSIGFLFCCALFFPADQSSSSNVPACTQRVASPQAPKRSHFEHRQRLISRGGIWVVVTTAPRSVVHGVHGEAACAFRLGGALCPHFGLQAREGRGRKSRSFLKLPRVPLRQAQRAGHSILERAVMGGARAHACEPVCCYCCCCCCCHCWLLLVRLSHPCVFSSERNAGPVCTRLEVFRGHLAVGPTLQAGAAREGRHSGTQLRAGLQPDNSGGSPLRPAAAPCFLAHDQRRLEPHLSRARRRGAPPAAAAPAPPTPPPAHTISTT